MPWLEATSCETRLGRMLPGELPGGRARRRHARLPALGRARDRAAAQGGHADACHVPLPEARQAGTPAAAHGGRGAGQPHPGAGTRVCVCSQAGDHRGNAGPRWTGGGRRRRQY
ncbi:Protein of unknown function [Gryllus bimaculatus]|nr:Protein of unknown function [Gryllus bimaculatus]